MTDESSVLAYLQEVGYPHLFSLVRNVRDGTIEIDSRRGSFHAVALACNVLGRCPGVRRVSVRAETRHEGGPCAPHALARR